jgi:hypothetical protein
MTDVQLLPNIREFNELTGAIFAQLYEAFPDLRDLNLEATAKILGRSIDEKLESGRPFRVMFTLTAGWLASEGFTHAFGDHPCSRVGLTTKALVAMNAVPEKLHQPLGAQLTEAAKQESNAGRLKLAELMGTFFGSAVGTATKSLGAG